ncbi:hypothetical protein ECPA45_1938, partial [Escherichia coli PA45]
CVQLDVNNG